MEKLDKVQSISSIERTMLELFQCLEVAFAMVENKIVRTVIHHFHELFTFPNDGNTLTPRQNRREQTGNFYILFPGEEVWDRNRIVLNELGPVEPVFHRVQQFLKIGF